MRKIPLKYLHLDRPFPLETGGILPRLSIAYTTHGQLAADKRNVIWVAHALTGNADPTDWWSGLVGPKKTIDTSQYFVVCANIIGSCYGTTGPHQWKADGSGPYQDEFPLITIRDMVQAHEQLRQHLNLPSIQLGIGGSMGGQQILEWSISHPSLFDKICVLATNAQHSPWGIAFNEAQRMALRADTSLLTDHPEAGRKGLEAARSIAMLSYRHYRSYDSTQAEIEEDKVEDFRASSYQRYQGQKLWQRFDPFSYLSLSRSMDSHHIGRGRGGVQQALQQITAQALVIGIDTDVLFPIEEQAMIARNIRRTRLEIISSEFGHDGFLTETPTINLYLRKFLQRGIPPGTPLQRELPTRIGAARPALPGTESF